MILNILPRCSQVCLLEPFSCSGHSSEQLGSAVVSDQSIDDAQHRAAAALIDVPEPVAKLGARFAAAGFELSLVGGTVRDAVLGRPSPDIDLTTNARPDLVQSLLEGWAHNVWDVGIAFGTVGARHGDHKLEITTYRAEAYDRESRKPDVSYGDNLEGDLLRRDFTVNAMALTLPGNRLIDPFGGLGDLVKRVIRTPGLPESSFDDDPLRMVRAARFVSQLGFDVDADVVTAMTSMAERIDIVSAERVREELVKLIMGGHPRAGLALMVSTGLAEHVLPELPKLALEIDEHHRHKDVYEHTLIVLEQAIEMESRHEPVSGPDFVLRFAALMHDIGKPKTRRFEDGGGVSFHHHEVVGAKMTRKRMQALRFSNDDIDAVYRLVELHLRFHGYGTGEWTDSAVRRYVRDAGALLPRLHKLTRADCTTRNPRKAESLARTYDSLEARIARLAEQEELDAIRPDLNGEQIMEVLGIGPSREVGEAYRFLLEVRLDEGPLDESSARDRLMTWWASRST